jgi:tRNA G46 methylase TrmB
VRDFQFKDQNQNNGESSNSCETEKFTDYTTTENYERSVAIERAYVHEVYENCCEQDAHPVRSRVAQQFISGLEAGSFVCDVGCGNGKYLTGYNPSIFAIGVERCSRLAKVAKSTSAEVN